MRSKPAITGQLPNGDCQTSNIVQGVVSRLAKFGSHSLIDSSTGVRLCIHARLLKNGTYIEHPGWETGKRHIMDRAVLDQHRQIVTITVDRYLPLLAECVKPRKRLGEGSSTRIQHGLLDAGQSGDICGQAWVFLGVDQAVKRFYFRNTVLHSHPNGGDLDNFAVLPGFRPISRLRAFPGGVFKVKQDDMVVQWLYPVIERCSPPGRIPVLMNIICTVLDFTARHCYTYCHEDLVQSERC